MLQIIQIYALSDGREPFSEWLETLKDVKGRARIRAVINRLRVGNPGKFKMVAPGILELKIDYGPGYRVYYGRSGKCLWVLLCGGNKSTQSDDIGKSERYFADYKRRMQGNG